MKKDTIIKYCCKIMKDWTDDNTIKLNNDNKPVICLLDSVEDDTWFDEYRISYCPFCGKKIKVLK